MLADCVGAGLRLVAFNAVGMGSCCINGRVAGLPVKVVQIAGSGGGGDVGVIVWKGEMEVAMLLREVKTVTAPAAAPILSIVLLLRSPFESCFALFLFFFDLAMKLSFSTAFDSQFQKRLWCISPVHNRSQWI